MRRPGNLALASGLSSEAGWSRWALFPQTVPTGPSHSPVPINTSHLGTSASFGPFQPNALQRRAAAVRNTRSDDLLCTLHGVENAAKTRSRLASTPRQKQPAPRGPTIVPIGLHSPSAAPPGLPSQYFRRRRGPRQPARTTRVRSGPTYSARKY